MLAVAAALAVFSWLGVSRAEQNGGSPISGVTSRIKTVRDTIFALSYGSDAPGAWGNWGAYWNRIYSAAEWAPSGSASATDIGSGSTFYSNSRTQQTGTCPASSSCSTQLYHDSHASATPANNCNLTWEVASPPVTGDEKKDPRPGLVWSQYLKNVGNVPTFAALPGSDWSWDGTTDADSIAVGNKTARQLCSERGDGWRLPTQKEMMQAYIDGTFWNLIFTPSNLFWTATESTATYAWCMNLATGYTTNAVKTQSLYVRCVR